MASEDFDEDIDELIQREEEELNNADEQQELKTSFEQEICKNLNKNLQMTIDDVIEKRGMTKTQRDHVSITQELVCRHIKQFLVSSRLLV
jgi:hypothetical protein